MKKKKFPPAYMGKRQNYILKMSKDLNFLKKFRSNFVNILCSVARNRNKKSTEDLFYLDINRLINTDKVIADEVRISIIENRPPSAVGVSRGKRRIILNNNND